MSKYNEWTNTVTKECYDFLELTGDIQNRYVSFVINYDYGTYELAKRIREDIEIKISEAIQTVDNTLIANLLYAVSYEIDYVEIATEIFHQAQNYI